MSWTAIDSNTTAASGSAHKYTQGAVLTPSGNSITPTDPLHHVAAGTISTIATSNIDTNLVDELILVANGAISITSGGNISGATASLAANDVIRYIYDGGTWRETRPNTGSMASFAVNVKAFGAVGDGTTDDSTPVANAATQARTTGQPLYFPKGKYLVKTALNLTLNSAVQEGQLIGTGGLIVYGDGASQSLIVGSTGGIVFDITGRGHVTFMDLGIIVGAGTPSTIGIYQARVSSGLGYSQFPQHQQFVRLYMYFGSATPAANGNVGTIGIYNTGGAESCVYENCQILADNPLVLTADNTYSLTSPYQTVVAAHSAAQNTVIGGSYYSTGSLAGNASITLQGVVPNTTIINPHLSKSTSGLTAPAFAIRILPDANTATQQIQNFQLRGAQVETYNQIVTVQAPLWGADMKASCQQIGGGAYILLATTPAKLEHSRIDIVPGEQSTPAVLISDGGVATGGVLSSEIHLYSPLTIVCLQSPGKGNTIHWDGAALPTLAWNAPDPGQVVRTATGTYLTTGTALSGSNAMMGKPAMLLTTNATQVGTDANTNPKDVWTYTLPANTLDTNGQAIRVRAWIGTAANGDTKTIQMSWGGTLVISTAAAFNNLAAMLELTIIRVGSTSQLVYPAQFFSSTQNNTIYVPSSQAKNFATDQIIKITFTNGTGAANDIIFYGAMVEGLFL